MKNKIISTIVILLGLFGIYSCEREVFTGPPEDPPAVNGKVYLNSEPQGAEIYVDQKDYGLCTPDTLTWLDSRDQLITLKTELFNDTSFIVYPVGDSLINIFVDYLANPNNYSTIKCYTEPEGAQIILNDSLLNRVTPDILTGLYPGDYKIKYTLPEHRSDSLSVFVKGSHSVEAFVALEDTSVFVAYTKSNSGLPSNLLSDAVIDQNGIKWLGTRDKGLVKFDGINWTTYNSSNSGLMSDFVTRVAIDGTNDIWIGTSSGLYKFNGSTWLNYSYLLPDPAVNAIAFDDAGNTWIGTQNGLVKFDGINYRIYNAGNSDLSGNYITVLLAEGNYMWIGTNAFGLNYFDGSNWTIYTKENTQMLGNALNCGYIDHSGKKWFDIMPFPVLEEYGGLVTVIGDTWETRSIGTEMELRKIYTILQDENENMWFGTKVGAAKLDLEGNIKRYKGDNSGIPSYQVNKIFIDSNNDLWIASSGGGLIKFKKNSE